ncbi:MAG: hypothetical protein ACYC8T_12340 [Myxococcaceae bacterium]
MPLLVPYLVCFAIAAVFVLLALTSPNSARVALSMLFFGGAALNLWVAVIDPLLFVDAVGPGAIAPYRAFLYGPFVYYSRPLLLAIADGQFLIGLLLLTRGRTVHLGLAASLVFLLALSGLGVSAFFPANLLLALAPALLLRQPFEQSLPGLILARLGRTPLP